MNAANPNQKNSACRQSRRWSRESKNLYSNFKCRVRMVHLGRPPIYKLDLAVRREKEPKAKTHEDAKVRQCLFAIVLEKIPAEVSDKSRSERFPFLLIGCVLVFGRSMVRVLGEHYIRITQEFKPRFLRQICPPRRIR